MIICTELKHPDSFVILESLSRHPESWSSVITQHGQSSEYKIMIQQDLLFLLSMLIITVNGSLAADSLTSAPRHPVPLAHDVCDCWSHGEG